MNLEEIFQNVLAKLERGERPLLRLSREDFLELKKVWTQASDTETIHKVLCLLDNCHSLSPEFDELIIEHLHERQHPQTIIFTLSAATKHVLALKMRNGDPVPAAFIDALGALLAHKNAEVLEWTLRTIVELGRQGKRLRAQIQAHRPGFSAIFNVHKRNAQEIIDLIERTWQGP